MLEMPKQAYCAFECLKWIKKNNDEQQQNFEHYD